MSNKTPLQYEKFFVADTKKALKYVAISGMDNLLDALNEGPVYYDWALEGLNEWREMINTDFPLSEIDLDYLGDPFPSLVEKIEYLKRHLNRQLA